MTLLEKNQVLQTNDSYFRVMLDRTGRLQLIIGSNASGNRYIQKSRAAATVAENTWEYWGISVRMDPDATH